MKINRSRNTKAATPRAPHAPPIRLRGTFAWAPVPRSPGWPEPPPGLVVAVSGPGRSGRFCVAVITTAASHLLMARCRSIQGGCRRGDVALNGVGPRRQARVGRPFARPAQGGAVCRSAGQPLRGGCPARVSVLPQADCRGSFGRLDRLLPVAFPAKADAAVGERLA